MQSTGGDAVRTGEIVSPSENQRPSTHLVKSTGTTDGTTASQPVGRIGRYAAIEGDRTAPSRPPTVEGVKRATVRNQRIVRADIVKLDGATAVERDRSCSHGIDAVRAASIDKSSQMQRAGIDDGAAAVRVWG